MISSIDIEDMRPDEGGKVAVPALMEGYGSTDFGYTFAGIHLEDGDKRLMAMLIHAFGTDHPAVDDLTALIWRSRAATQPSIKE